MTLAVLHWFAQVLAWGGATVGALGLLLVAMTLPMERT